MPDVAVPPHSSATTLVSRYRRGAPIARGGMGHVYCAEDVTTGRLVAFKVLRPELFRNVHARERFRREAMALRAINHPGIVSLLDFGCDESDGYFLVMELLEGENLCELISRGPVSAERCADLGIQAAEALDCVHRTGILHRDIKPSNMETIHRGGREQLVIVDFGLAKLGASFSLGDITGKSSVWGTPRYMAPELIAGHDATVASDIYSLGCVLYELIAGRTPRQGSLGAFLSGDVSRIPTPLSRLAPRAPGRILEVIDRMVAPEPEARPESMAEVARLLHAALGGSLRRLARGSMEPPRRSGRTHLPHALFVALVVLLFGHAIISVVSLACADPPHPPTIPSQ